MRLHHTLGRAARRFPEREAVVWRRHSPDAPRVERAGGAALRAANDAPRDSGDRVAVLMHNRHRFMEAHLATERAGAVLVPTMINLLIDSRSVRVRVVRPDGGDVRPGENV